MVTKTKTEKQSKIVKPLGSETEIGRDDSLFPCPNAGCTKEYQRYSGLEKHILYGKCQLAPERETLMDKAKILYTTKLVEGGGRANPNIKDVGTTEKQSEIQVTALPSGWALKTTKKAKRFTTKQKSYLDDKFKIRQETGNKADPAAVAQDMRYAKDSEGKRLFQIEEFLTGQQIKSYFSRKSAKVRRGGIESENHDSDEEDELAADDEESYHRTHQIILQEVQLKHPIVYDTLNICTLFSKNKLSNLSVFVLRSVCEHFDLAIDHIKVRRKAPYLSLINDMVESCTCQRE